MNEPAYDERKQDLGKSLRRQTKSKTLTDEEWLLVKNILAHRLSEMANRAMLLDHEREEWDAIHHLLEWKITP